MRILALVTDAFGGYGGIAQYNCDLLSALALSDCVSEVVVLPRVAGSQVSNLPAKVRQLAPHRGRAAYIAQSLAMAGRERAFDVIFCGHIFHAPLALLIARLQKAPVWQQTHGIEAWGRPGRMVGSAIERSSLITTVSRYTRRKLLSWADVEPERVRVLSNTFRPLFAPGPKDRALLERFGLGGAKIILTVSRIAKADSYKGHALVIDVLARVLETFSDARYVIIGDGDARPSLEAYAALKGVGGAVRFLGRLSDADVLQFYRSSDVFVMPSSKEGFGIVFVEAAATGLPVIGGNCDGSADALADGAVGTMIDPGDPKAMAQAILCALSGAAKVNPNAVHRFAFRGFSAHADSLIRSLQR